MWYNDRRKFLNKHSRYHSDRTDLDALIEAYNARERTPLPGFFPEHLHARHDYQWTDDVIIKGTHSQEHFDKKTSGELGGPPLPDPCYDSLKSWLQERTPMSK